MLNCLVLGSGRSGTSMVAGCLHGAGYWLGEDLLPPTEGNPKGYFESRVIETINEELLMSVARRRPKGLLGKLFPHRFGPAQRWLARVPLGTVLKCPHRLAERIRAQMQREPYCFKDPRFCYTLPAWKPFLKDTVFVCVFRQPAATATSIVKECKDAPYLHSLYMDFDIALDVWRLMYEHILRLHMHDGNWLFIHFDQVLNGDGLERLAQHVDADIDRDFPDAALRRSSSATSVAPTIERVYKELCELSGYKPV